MASNIYSYFFKQENSTLTPEEFQAQGILAGEAKNGFVEVALNNKKLYTINDNVTQEKYKEEEKHFFDIVINSLKPNTPPLLLLSSGSFGDCFDDDIYIAEIDPLTFAKTKYSNCQQIFSKHYEDTPYFDTVDFARYTSDLITEKQIDELKDFVMERENEEYQAWISKQEDDSEEGLLRMLITLVDKTHAQSWKLSREEESNLRSETEKTIKYLQMHFGMPYQSDAKSIRY